VARWRVDFQAEDRLWVSVSVAPFQRRCYSRFERRFVVTRTFTPLEGSPPVVAVAPASNPVDRGAIRLASAIQQPCQPDLAT
jgi:ureidoglycolate hydrolase